MILNLTDFIYFSEEIYHLSGYEREYFIKLSTMYDVDGCINMLSKKKPTMVIVHRDCGGFMQDVISGLSEVVYPLDVLKVY